MINIIKRVYSKLYYFKNKYSNKYRYKFIVDQLKYSKNEKRILLMGTSIYGNLGDQAISESEIKFIKENFSNVKLIEVPGNFYITNEKIINQYITSNDLLILTGGGFLGSLWPEGQDIANRLIQNFKQNKIVIFPQTIYYSPENEVLIEDHKNIYSSHKNLSMIVRDKRSQEFLYKNSFKFKNILYTPDIVTFLDENNRKERPEYISLILREDKESVIDLKKIKTIQNILKELNEENLRTEEYDTVLNKKIDLLNRKNELNLLFNKISKSKIVVTDRLHGMLLSVICGIPVIALDNISKKVYGSYQWLEKLGYVYYVSDEIDKEKIRYLFINRDNFNYNNFLFKDYHDEIVNLVRSELSEIQ
ncbi:polysaccharide pyruvyl transferase family protein [Facklamia sp. P13064]|uniref:polysaccharide pyruvyl transferase family protein n=1 Tax=Facklamia sp. P13064 TaxID=3421953 RepID=UPI003D174C7C